MYVLMYVMYDTAMSCMYRNNGTAATCCYYSAPVDCLRFLLLSSAAAYGRRAWLEQKLIEFSPKTVCRAVVISCVREFDRLNSLWGLGGKQSSAPVAPQITSVPPSDSYPAVKLTISSAARPLHSVVLYHPFPRPFFVSFRVKALTWGIKGVGCQGDGSVQMVARGPQEQEELIQVLKEMGEEGIGMCSGNDHDGFSPKQRANRGHALVPHLVYTRM